jgi:DNA damage-inducible protein 1
MVQLAAEQARQKQAQGPPVPEGDPLDPEYQRKMYEYIQQKNVEENFEHAMEHSPEVFGEVDMLYVNMTVNGEPVKAFIDSGAQSTIMTQACAEKCRIMRLVDKRFAGVAVGVGSAKIIGRIHTCSLKVGAEFITTSVTVLDQRDGPQFIFGLDNLKRHQCCIDLASNQLKVGTCGVELPFLPSHEVPRDFNNRRVNSNDVRTIQFSSSLDCCLAPWFVVVTTSGCIQLLLHFRACALC